MAMTEEEVAAWMASHGVDESVIKDEAGYVAEHYADPDEDPLKVLESSLGSYIQRTESGGDREEGGYSTDYDDPAVETDYGTTPARDDSPQAGPEPSQPAVVQATSGSPVMTALQTKNAPLIEKTQAAVDAQRAAAAATSTDMPVWSELPGGVYPTTTTILMPATTPTAAAAGDSSSPLVPIGVGLVLLKLVGVL